MLYSIIANIREELVICFLICPNFDCKRRNKKKEDPHPELLVDLFDKKGQLVLRKKGYLQGDELKMLEEVKKLK